MAYKIDPEKCVGCGACKENCPAGAISEAEMETAEGKKEMKCVIDAATCAGCGCCVGVCPAGAIAEE